jgi:hypothetical protein
MIGITAEAWSYCVSRSDSDMLRVWFSCRPFMLSEHGVKMTATLEKNLVLFISFSAADLFI